MPRKWIFFISAVCSQIFVTFFYWIWWNWIFLFRIIGVCWRTKGRSCETRTDWVYHYRIRSRHVSSTLGLFTYRKLSSREFPQFNFSKINLIPLSKNRRVKPFLDSFVLPNITIFRSFCKLVSIMPNSFFVLISSVRCSFHWKIIIGVTRQHQSLWIWFWPLWRPEHMPCFKHQISSISARVWCRW